MFPTLRTCCAVSLFALVPASSAAAQGPAPQKFAYVNTQDILAAAPGRAEAEAQLQKEGGLKGLSGGLSNDVRDIQDAASKGNAKAKLAINVFLAVELMTSDVEPSPSGDQLKLIAL